MEYLISFLEGIITFLSPCLLPMIPIYLSYFAGSEEEDSRHTLRGALGFVLGFTVTFVALGALAGTLGSLLRKYQTAVNILTGGLVILFGLNFLGVFNLSIFKGAAGRMISKKVGFFPAMMLGLVFSLAWSPCVGAFLGSALALASQQGHVLKGMAMLLIYSLGLGIPFVLSALLIDRLKTAFDWIKRHYTIITRISGVFLVAVGILMATGTLGALLLKLS